MKTFLAGELENYAYVLNNVDHGYPAFLIVQERVSHVIITKDDYDNMLSNQKTFNKIKKIKIKF